MFMVRSALLLCFVAGAFAQREGAAPRRGGPVLSPSFNPDATVESNKQRAVELDANDKAICPLDDGLYEDPFYCDGYWECKHGVATEHFCADGLVFDHRKSHTASPCDTPHIVHCGDRQALQEPSLVSEFCPRKFGSFEHPDPTICNVYFTCLNGDHTEVSCANGLYFNASQGSCNWPRIALRTGCMEKAVLNLDGTEACPPGPHNGHDGLPVPHPSFPDLEDCSKFTVCLNGVTPQKASCDQGLVFDSRTMLCQLPDQVPECAGWYADDPKFAHYYDDVPVSNSRNDPGKQDVVG